MVGLSELKQKLAALSFNRICADGSAAEIEAMLQTIDASQVELLKIEDQLEDQRRDALAAGDDDKVAEVEKQQDDLRRELDRVSAQLERGKARLEEVKAAEAKAELDAQFAEGEAAQADVIQAFADYERAAAKIADALRRIEDGNRRVTLANEALRAAKDPRKVRLAAGVVAEQRGALFQFDLPKNVRLQAVVGHHHFWPPAKG